jgi:hypothetical protein
MQDAFIKRGDFPIARLVESAMGSSLSCAYTFTGFDASGDA